MKTALPIAFGALLIGTAAIAQTNQPQTPTAPPAAKPAPTITTPAPTPEASRAPSTGSSVTLTDTEAKDWVDKVVYSADGKNIGEVAEFARDGSGRVTALHADLGGFAGMGETRVRVMPNQFRLERDRVVLLIPADQWQSLPKIPKS